MLFKKKVFSILCNGVIVCLTELLEPLLVKSAMKVHRVVLLQRPCESSVLFDPHQEGGDLLFIKTIFKKKFSQKKSFYSCPCGFNPLFSISSTEQKKQ
jgi:hypothetical protein